MDGSCKYLDMGPLSPVFSSITANLNLAPAEQVRQVLALVKGDGAR